MLASVVWIAWAASSIAASASLVGRSLESSSSTTSFPYYLDGVVFIVAVVGLIGGLVGLHARQEESYGWLGAAGFFASFVGVALAFVLVLDRMLVPVDRRSFFERLVGLGPLWGVLGGPALLSVGFLLLGIATMRARVLPHWCGVVLVILLPTAGILTTVWGFYWGGVAFGAGWLALGAALWIASGEAA